MNTLLRYLFWPVFFISHLLAISLLAWHLLAQIDFAYPIGYKMLDLHAHILEHAPRNRFKADFVFTTQEQHWELFSEITSAVQHNGKGLTDIRYHLPNGSYAALMHQAEIIHLHDVSNLIDLIYKIGIVSWFISIALLLFAYQKKLTFPHIKKIFLGFAASTITVVILVLSVGATKLFYWLHTKIFPEGHQWFFYYEDSLMTTLMKAPDIFAFIAVLLMSLIIILWGASVFGINKLLKKTLITAKQTRKSKQKH